MSDIHGSLSPVLTAVPEPYSVSLSRQDLLAVQSAAYSDGPDASLHDVMKSQTVSLVVVLAEVGSVKLIDGFLSPLGLVLQGRAESEALPVKTGVFPRGSIASGVASLLRLEGAAVAEGDVDAAPLGVEVVDADQLVRDVIDGRINGIDSAVVIYRKEGESRLTLVQARGGSRSWWSFEEGSQVRLRTEPLMGFACGFADIIAVDRS